MTDSSLAGFRVTELAAQPACAYAGKLLADLGAEVIKIEPPATGDAARRAGPFPGGLVDPEASGTFLFLNTNKLSVTLDLERPEAQRLLHELVGRSNVVLEDCIDGRTLAAEFPSVVVTSISPFGRSGPFTHYRGHNLTTAHSGGEAYHLPRDPEHPDRAPVKPGGHLNDFTTGMHAALATVAALYACESDGLGQWIDVSAQEAAMAIDPVLIGTYTMAHVVEGQGAAIRRASLGGQIRCCDGYLQTFLGFSDEHWRAMVHQLDDPEWAQAEKFQTVIGRREAAAELFTRMREFARQHTMAEMWERAVRFKCPIGYFATAEDLLASPQLAARQFFVDIEHARTGPLKYASSPYKLSDASPEAEHHPRPAPFLGQHNQLVYEGLVGHSPSELAEWRTAGLI